MLLIVVSFIVVDDYDFAATVGVVLLMLTLLQFALLLSLIVDGEGFKLFIMVAVMTKNLTQYTSTTTTKNSNKN